MPTSRTGTSTRIDGPAGQSAPALQADAGFTFVEILVVLMLVATLFAIVLPKTGRTATLPSATRQLVSTIRSASLAASASQRLHLLYIDLDQRRYWIMQVLPDGERPPGDPTLAQPIVLPDTITVYDVTTGRGRITAGRASVQLFPFGRADRATIHLADQDLNVWTLQLNPLTSDVKLTDRNVDPPATGTIPERLRPWFLMGFSPTGAPASLPVPTPVPGGGFR